MNLSKGFYFSFIPSLSGELILSLKRAAAECREFVIGIPSEVAAGRFHHNGGYDPKEIRDCLQELRFVSETFIIEEAELDFALLHKKIGFDAWFYGSEYGRQFDLDGKYAGDHGVSMIPLIPAVRRMPDAGDPLAFALDNTYSGRKIILFGTGAYFDAYMNACGAGHRPAYAVDSSPEKAGGSKAGIEIKPVDSIRNEDAGNILVILCAKNYAGMKRVLLSCGDYDYRPMLYDCGLALMEECIVYKKKKDFLASEQKRILSKVQEIDYAMLEKFDSVCRKYDIEYFLNFGSLLGALRHKAIIPWDNDVDTVMKRTEWDKIRQHKDEFSGDYFWLGNDILGNKKYFDCLDRIGYKNAYIRLDRDFCEYYENYFNSIHLDMFLIDKTYDNFRGKLQRYELALLYGLMNAYRHEYLFSDYSREMRFKNNIMRALGKFFPLEWLKKTADRVARRFDDDENAPYYFISNDVLAKLMMLIPAGVFERAVDAPFGALASKIPCRADQFCRMIFGDYMQLPPENQRIPHCGRIVMTADSYVFEEPVRGNKHTK